MSALGLPVAVAIGRLQRSTFLVSTENTSRSAASTGGLTSRPAPAVIRTGAMDDPDLVRCRQRLGDLNGAADGFLHRKGAPADDSLEGPPGHELHDDDLGFDAVLTERCSNQRHE